MRLIRSWPKHPPTDRACVDDEIERLVINNHDYSRLPEIEDDIVLLEWDVAVGREELRDFMIRARTLPNDILVAPYRIYADSAYRLPDDIWAHRHWDGEPVGMANPEGAKPVQTGDPFCNLFGLGMVYLPYNLICNYMAAKYANHFGDVEFSMWHYRNVKKNVPISWETPAVHLHYQTKGLCDGRVQV